MRSVGAARQFGRRSAAAGLALIAAMALTSGIATAEPAAPAPVTGPMLFTLTSMPNGWLIGRTDLRPLLEVQADGRAVKRPDGADPNRKADTPAKEVTGSIPRDVLTAAIAETQALAPVDLGMPTVSDQGSLIIDYTPQQADQDVHLIAYAPEFSDGLDADQQANRGRFATLYKKLLDAFVADR
ncbi:hypothetical protein [Nocardia sp. NPDC050406]|uniref:hypothetical protein n=1 Tax=Nocardia sp. NPDC050406 TaxID=3364318 RepID=UPI003795C564